MGVTGENLAEKYNITRQDCDEFALLSQKRWAEGKYNYEAETHQQAVPSSQSWPGQEYAKCWRANLLEGISDFLFPSLGSFSTHNF